MSDQVLLALIPAAVTILLAIIAVAERVLPRSGSPSSPLPPLLGRPGSRTASNSLALDRSNPFHTRPG